MKLRVGITGQPGFVGTHLFNTLGLYPDEFERVPFEDAYFQNPGNLDRFVRSCDVIVHLAAVNRCPSEEELYETNIRLVRQLVEAMEKASVTPHVLFSSSIQEDRNNVYGRSKREGRRLFGEWAARTGGEFTGLVIPNVFGPFGRPNYNSFVATFSHRLTHGETPTVQVDADVPLIYVGSLCDHIVRIVRHDFADLDTESSGASARCVRLPPDFTRKVTDILRLFEMWRDSYLERGELPPLSDRNEVNLFNTFRCYADLQARNPVPLTLHTDPRGSFVETIRLQGGGQVSFSTTHPGITRGEHYHTRKIERFTVIKGKARIRLRRVGTPEILAFDIDGDRPAYVDIPVWYTHNVTNIGDEDLYMQFWISEWYDPADADTFYEKVGDPS